MDKVLVSGVKKPVRMISGVTVVAVMSKPFPCPHGRCMYCPGGVDIGTPQSYLEDSPAVMRALQYNFDPYDQVRGRLLQYVAMGHKPSKIELIVMGGTFPAMPRDYQEWFIANALEAMNRFPRKKLKEPTLEKAQFKNEKAGIRCIGLTLETRPDWSKEKHVDWFLHLGATRIELGVQTVYDDILLKIDRGHTVKDSVEATRILKDAGYKVVYHLMPGLPGSDPDRDFEMFKEVFENSQYRPDMLKIYPTLVIPGTKLYEKWREGCYRSYSIDVWIELLAKIKSIIPKYVRIMRIQRDLPLHHIVDGPRIGNLRQVVQEYMKKRGMRCKCIRCREVGHYMLKIDAKHRGKLRLEKIVYEASGGTEVFLSYVDDLDLIYGLLRLRIPSEHAHRWEVNDKTAIIRELHVYGPQVPVGEFYQYSWQHKGLGKNLMLEAERIAVEEFDKRKILVISGIGVREYYRKLGYRRHKNSFYMVKYI
ncbi:MAG: tRNA uridine(34) 5-carboxymethylaminomethyl modification radical SAM/GNAT enzyme Elp3 [Thermoproteales archaeon]|nr:tRNA uridine(34) 5-carboxymethylaminomethyl modification radical SAM/GNAT enzyme Elp3 [Thermoproteales archaeon]